MLTSSTTLDSNRSIVRSAARFFSGTMLSRVTGMLRDICMAYAFGTQSAIAALLVAFRFAHLLRRLLGEGAMQTALIPHFEELRKEDPQRAGRFFCDLTATLLYLLTFIIVIVMAVLWGCLQWGNLDSGNAEIVWLTFLMMPSLFFICLFGINASLMQCEKSFFVSSAAPVAFNLFWIIGIAVSARLSSADAMTVLSLFIIAACLAQWSATLPKVYKILKSLNIKSLWKGVPYSADVRRLAKPLALGIIGIGASQINNALDAIFARWADAEGPAILWYAIRLQQLPLALFGIAIANALLPPLARAGKNNDSAQFSHFLDFAVGRTIILMLPMTAGLLLLGDACIQLVYGRGDFTLASVISTTSALWGYTIGLFPMALILILAPAFYAKGNYRTPSTAAVGAMILNTVLNATMIAFLGLGATSIAIATSISSWMNFFWLGYRLNQEIPWINKSLLAYGMKVCVATAAASCATVMCHEWLWGSFPAWAILQGAMPDYAASLWHQISVLLVDGGVFLGVFLSIFVGSLVGSLDVFKDKVRKRGDAETRRDEKS